MKTLPADCLTRLLTLTGASLLITTLAACGGGGGGDGDGPDSSSQPDPVAGPSGYTTAEDYLESLGFVGTALIRKGDTDLVRRGFGYANLDLGRYNDVHTRFRLGSVTKMFTALAVLQLQKQGFIAGFDDPVGSYLPDYPHGEITIRQLIQHSSGIPDYLLFVDDTQPHTPLELVEAFAEEDLLFEPGSGFAYSNSNYALLGLLIETLTGMDYMTYLNASLLHPLGMVNTQYGSNTLSSQGYAQGYGDYEDNEPADYVDMSVPYSAGALVSDINDLEIWGDALLDHQIITPADEAEVFPKPADGSVLEEGYFLYGFGWFVRYLDGHWVYEHGGDIEGFTTLMALVPDSDGIVVLLSNEEGVGNRRYEILETLVEHEF